MAITTHFITAMWRIYEQNKYTVGLDWLDCEKWAFHTRMEPKWECSGLPDDYFPPEISAATIFEENFKAWKLKNKFTQIFRYSIFFIPLPLTSIKLLLQRIIIGSSLKKLHFLQQLANMYEFVWFDLH